MRFHKEIWVSDWFNIGSHDLFLEITNHYKTIPNHHEPSPTITDIMNYNEPPQNITGNHN